MLYRQLLYIRVREIYKLILLQEQVYIKYPHALSRLLPWPGPPRDVGQQLVCTPLGHKPTTLIIT